jgi:hypothetical protein
MGGIVLVGGGCEAPYDTREQELALSQSSRDLWHHWYVNWELSVVFVQSCALSFQSKSPPESLVKR